MPQKTRVSLLCGVDPGGDPLSVFQFKNPLILLLLGSAVVSVLTKQYEDAVSITMVSGSDAGCPGLAYAARQATSQGRQPRAAWPTGLQLGSRVQGEGFAGARSFSKCVWVEKSGV